MGFCCFVLRLWCFCSRSLFVWFSAFSEFPPELFGSRLVKMLTFNLETSLQGAHKALVQQWQQAHYERK
jgi:hypothetical protein